MDETCKAYLRRLRRKVRSLREAIHHNVVHAEVLSGLQSESLNQMVILRELLEYGIMKG